MRLLELFKLLCATDAFAECGSPKRCGHHGVLSVASTVENGVTASLHVLGLGVSSFDENGLRLTGPNEVF